LFASPVVAAGFLIVNGAILFGAERLRGRAPAERPRALSRLSNPDALAIGCDDRGRPAARARPCGSGAFLVHDRHARDSGRDGARGAEATAGGGAGGHIRTRRAGRGGRGVTAFVSTWVLMRWFRRHDEW